MTERRNRFIYDHLRRISLWPRRIVSHSKYSDRRQERPIIESEYIDEEFLKNRNKKQKGRCFYCKFQMQKYDRKAHDGLTCERLDMNQPHTKTNVVLCCSSCNCRKFTPESLTRKKTKKYLRNRKKRANTLKEIHDEICKYSVSRRGAFVA